MTTWVHHAAPASANAVTDVFWKKIGRSFTPRPISESGARYSTLPAAARTPSCVPPSKPRTPNVRAEPPTITPGASESELPFTPPALNALVAAAPVTP